MSLRAAAQVVLDDLTEVSRASKMPGDAVAEAIETLRDGLIEHRAQERGLDLYKALKAVMDSCELNMDSMEPETRVLIKRTAQLLQEIEHGSPE